MMITRANVNQLLDAGEIYAAITNGRWWKMRRNGATKTWKRDTSRIRIPFKYGFRGTGAIDESDFDPNGYLNAAYYRHISDIPEAHRS